MANVSEARTIAAGSLSRPPKIRPAKTTRFFVHCPGRSEIRSATKRDRPGACRAVCSVAMFDERERAMQRGIRNLDLGGREAPDGVGLGIVRLEYREQLGDGQEVRNPLRQVDELQAPALAA